MSTKDFSAIPVLTTGNYLAWSQKIDGYFTLNNLDDLVYGLERSPDSAPKDPSTGTEGEGSESSTSSKQYVADNANEWKRRAKQASAAITLTVDETNMSQIRKLKGDPVAMWNKLESIHNAKTSATRFNALEAFFTKTKAEGEPLASITAATNALEEQFRSLWTTDYDVDALLNDLAMMSSLRMIPPESIHVRTSLLCQPNLTRDVIDAALVNEDNQQRRNSQPAIALRAATSQPITYRSTPPHSSRPKPTAAERTPGAICDHCGKRNHTAAQCWSKAEATRRKQEAARVASTTDGSTTVPNAHAAHASTLSLPSTARSDLNADTGATRTMMSDESYFTMLRPLVRSIKLANGERIFSTGEGDVVFQPWIDGYFSSDLVTFPNVLFAPDLQSNLVSVLSMARKEGYDIRINPKQMEFYLDGKLQMTARIDDDCVAYLNGRVLTFEQAHAASTLKLDRELWHRRLGHYHHDGVDTLIRHNLVNGIKLDSNAKPDPICAPCIAGKQTRAPHTTPATRATTPLDRVFIDLKGPINVESMPHRAKYWMAMVDDASNFVTLSLLHSKDGAFRAFCEFHKLAENQTGQHLVHLRDDKGGEFSGKEFEQYCISAGITRERTIVATPEQNGRVERANRWIAEGTIAKLTEANLPPSFWGFAALATVHEFNRARVHNGKTPYEHWHGETPSVDHLRVFGCLAYVFVPKSQRDALDSHTDKCIFVGYPSDRPGWVFWNPQTRKIIHSDRRPVPTPIPPEPAHEPVPPPAPAQAQPKPTAPARLSRELRALTDKTNFEKAPTNLPVRRHTVARQPGTLTESDSDLELNESFDEDNVQLATEDASLPSTSSSYVPTKARRWRPKPNFEAPDHILIPIVDGVEAALNTSTIREPTTLGEALKRPDGDKYVQAAIEEVRAHLENGTWKLVRLPQGKKAIGSRWVFKIKRDADGSISKYKGRIVAKGYAQREGIDYTETFAPTARFGALRTIIALAALEDWELESVDISTAFLNGEIDAEVYMRKPEGVEFEGYEGTSWVLQLLKGLYGIKQGPRIWSVKLHAVLSEIGFKRLESDHSVFIYERDSVKIIVPVHVDDLLLASKSSKAIQTVKDELKARFKIHDQGPTSFLLGVKLERNRQSHTISLSQPAYIEQILEAYEMKDCNGADTPMVEKPLLSAKDSPQTEQEKAEMQAIPYREALGKLIYLATATRPDISYDTLKRVLRYLRKTTNYKLTYGLKPESDELFTTHSDADLGGNADNTRSTAGFVMSIGGGAVMWSSRLQRHTSLSSTESEYTTASATGCEMIWMRAFLDEIGYDVASTPSTLYVDNASAIQVAKNPEHQSTMKHVHRSFNWIRERVANNEIRVAHVPGAVNVADIFTKPLGRIKFEQFVKMLGIIPHPHAHP
ncbi:hypothetical protein PIIN_07498 [Serendipita indica DSM 11827]|uniref:Integrase catalytic domain-containing protein n=1 Tax=Serendipita indica (strain DSM 11827) TaxID=1109443 RepID=G4TQF2_SERID|nr:hypothetical protein PIIN_07498 [Serendipita indica DSM 11827]